MIDSRTDKAGWTGKIFRQVLVVTDFTERTHPISTKGPT